jgi:hypothetical protein
MRKIASILGLFFLVLIISKGIDTDTSLLSVKAAVLIFKCIYSHERAIRTAIG